MLELVKKLPAGLQNGADSRSLRRATNALLKIKDKGDYTTAELRKAVKAHCKCIVRVCARPTL